VFVNVGMVKVSLCLTKHNAMKTHWRSGGIAHSFLTLALEGGEWSVSRSGCFIPQRKSLRYLLDRMLGGLQSRSGRGGEEKIPSPCRDSNPETPIVQPISWSLYRPSHCSLTLCLFRSWDVTNASDYSVCTQLLSPGNEMPWRSSCKITVTGTRLLFRSYDFWRQCSVYVACLFLNIA
jgi:hypothetical protein